VIDAPAPAPGGASRADAQRDRILSAALQCFIEHGFHAATMASIAETAQMSAGLIYRYFENKNAIVLAIVQRQLDEKRALIRQLQSSEQFVDGLLHAFDELCSTAGGSMSAVLMLEMSAEATRSPPIAAALRESDRLTRAEFEDWLCRARSQGGAGLSAAQASSRSLAIRFVVDGLALRAAREPELDRAQVREALEELLRTLLKPSDQ
jgi:AcrR family transcriptional regulator